MDIVEFKTTDAKGAPVNFSTPRAAILTAKPRPQEWQVNKGLGYSGATRRFVNIGLASGTLTLVMVNAAQRVEFELGCKRYLVSPPQGQPAKIYTAKHPRLARLSISRITLDDEPAGDWDRTAQIETVVYNWTEDRKPLPVLSSPTAEGSTKDGPKAANKATEGAKAVIAENKAAIDALSKQLAGTP